MNFNAFMSCLPALVAAVMASAANTVLPGSQPEAFVSQEDLSVGGVSSIKEALLYRDICQAVGQELLVVDATKLGRLATVMSRHSMREAFVQLKEFNLKDFAWVATVTGGGEHKTVTLSLLTGVPLAEKAFKIPALCAMPRDRFPQASIPDIVQYGSTLEAQAEHASTQESRDRFKALVERNTKSQAEQSAFILSASVSALGEAVAASVQPQLAPFEEEEDVVVASSQGTRGNRVVYAMHAKEKTVLPRSVLRYEGDAPRGHVIMTAAASQAARVVNAQENVRNVAKPSASSEYFMGHEIAKRSAIIGNMSKPGVHVARRATFHKGNTVEFNF